MLKIFFENGSRTGTEVSFPGRHIVCLGRHPDNDLVFFDAHERIVSSFHAEIRTEGTSVRIRDCNSTNGLFVNGTRLEEAVLMKTDLVELGKDGPCLRVELIKETAEGIPKTDAIHVPTERNLGRTASSDDPALKQPKQKEPNLDVSGRASRIQDGKHDKKRFGERTAGLLIQRALEQAGVLRRAGTSKSTHDIEAMVETRVKLLGLRQRNLLLLIAGLVLFAGIAVAFYLWNNRGPGQAGGALSDGLLRGESIAQKNRYAILMLAGRPHQSSNGELEQLKGFCTAFAVARNIIATNAHCIQKARNYGEIVAVVNGAPQKRYSMVATAVHPDYVEGKLSPDVALIRISGQLEHMVTIAPVDELAKTVTGVPMYLYGFPDRLNREDSPEATFVKGDIGRVTTFDNRTGDFGENTLLQHSAYATEGTSGSPIFNAAGQVIGINAGGYADDGRVLSGYNFAMRIDLINVLLPMLKGGQI